MRVLQSVLLALPLLGAASADGGFFDQYKAKFQDILGSISQAPDKPADIDAATAVASGADKATAAAVKAVTVEPRPTEQLTLQNWESTLYSRVDADATTPEQWFVLITGRNKTCFGRCNVVDEAFSIAAPKLSSIADGPNTATLNCEDESILCNAWSATPGYVYLFELLPKPAKTDVYYKRLNLSTTTAETFEELYQDKTKAQFEVVEGMFHPLDGFLAANGLAVPLGYVLWGLSVVPQWMIMILVSFVSRTFVSRRMQPAANRPSAAMGRAAAGAAPAAAAR